MESKPKLTVPLWSPTRTPNGNRSVLFPPGGRVTCWTSDRPALLSAEILLVGAALFAAIVRASGRDIFSISPSSCSRWVANCFHWKVVEYHLVDVLGK